MNLQTPWMYSAHFAPKKPSHGAFPRRHGIHARHGPRLQQQRVVIFLVLGRSHRGCCQRRRIQVKCTSFSSLLLLLFPAFFLLDFLPFHSSHFSLFPRFPTWLLFVLTGVRSAGCNLWLHGVPRTIRRQRRRTRGNARHTPEPSR